MGNVFRKLRKLFPELSFPDIQIVYGSEDNGQIVIPASPPHKPDVMEIVGSLAGTDSSHV